MTYGISRIAKLTAKDISRARAGGGKFETTKPNELQASALGINNTSKIPKEQINIEQERNETIQDVIDRLLYLPEDKLKEYKHYLNLLVSVYPIDMKIENGIRIYHVSKRK